MGKQLRSLFFFACIFLLTQVHASAENTGQQKNLLLKFHSFAMNPGDKVVGLTVTVSRGEIVNVMMPRGWSRKFSGAPNRKHSVHCFSTHSTFGIAASGRMPVMSIIDTSSTSGLPAIEASVDIEGSDSKVYSKQLRESELDIQ